MTGTAPSTPPLLVRGLRKRYADVVAVDGLDLEIGTGECFGLLGPNGAGKTTTIEICEGLTTPDEGEVLVLGRRWGEHDRELRARLGISLQETQFSEKLPVEETVRLFRSFYRRGPTVAEVIATVQLQEKRGSRVGQLSGGQRQRLALACALVGDPDLLFLDEPTTGLDPFKADGRGILLTTHYMEEAERLCDRVAIVDHGRIIALGTPRELVASLSAEHVVEFAVGPAARLDEGALQALVGVSAATRRDGTWRVRVAELHRTVPALLDELHRQNAQLTELRTHSATLEDVFVELTGRRLRDE